MWVLGIPKRDLMECDGALLAAVKNVCGRTGWRSWYDPDQGWLYVEGTGEVPEELCLPITELGPITSCQLSPPTKAAAREER